MTMLPTSNTNRIHPSISFTDSLNATDPFSECSQYLLILGKIDNAAYLPPFPGATDSTGFLVFGEPFMFPRPLTVLEVVAHEMAHGGTHFTAGLRDCPPSSSRNGTVIRALGACRYRASPQASPTRLSRSGRERPETPHPQTRHPAAAGAGPVIGWNPRSRSRSRSPKEPPPQEPRADAVHVLRQALSKSESAQLPFEQGRLAELTGAAATATARYRQSHALRPHPANPAGAALRRLGLTP